MFVQGKAKKIMLAGAITAIVIGVLVALGVFDTSTKDADIQQVRGDSKTYALIDACQAKLAEQSEYLTKEDFSKRITFDQFSIRENFTKKPADLDFLSVPSASAFRAKIGEELKRVGVNFAGHYSIVSVSVTDWGDNYWIVDRNNGKAYEFPYKATYLEFKKDSNLIIMDSKKSIEKGMETMDSALDVCAYIGPVRHYDLRPFYFTWKESGTVQLEPQKLTPPANTFWLEYFE